jgi:hypothetical protein
VSEISSCRSRVWDDARGRSVEVRSENDIAGLVAGIVKDLIMALKLDARVCTEVGTFAVRRDLWVLTMYGTPVGMVQVKRPDASEKEKGESADCFGKLL